MLKSGMIFRGQAYVKVRGSWYLLATIAKKIDHHKELKPVG
jgi:hypothetical protein